MKAAEETESALAEIHMAFCSAFERRDVEGVMRLFAPDADTTVVTSEDALLRGPEEIRAFMDRYVAGATTYSWVWDRRQVSSSDVVGWLLAEGTETAVSPGRREVHPYRMTMVLERRDGHWLLRQVHGSSPHTS
jgi:uncharacterized protein (TIGR02246 family)